MAEEFLSFELAGRDTQTEQTVRHSERMASVAAVLTTVLSIVCCLPFALPAALGLAGLGVVLGSIRPWLTIASLVLLAVGAVQLYRRRACGRKSRVSLVLFGIAALIVLGFVVFPQLVATVLADLE